MVIQGIVHVNMVKTLIKIDFNVVDDIVKWFTQVLALNTIYCT